MTKSTQLLIQVASIIDQKSPALVLIANLFHTPGTGRNEKQKTCGQKHARREKTKQVLLTLVTLSLVDVISRTDFE